MQRAFEAEQKVLALKEKNQVKECSVKLNWMRLNEPAIVDFAQRELPTTANEMAVFCAELKEKSK